MFKKKALYVILILFCSFSLFPVEVNPEWVKKDESVISTVLTFIEENNCSDARIKKLMNCNGKYTMDQENLGFGLKKFSSKLPGGYMSIKIDYVSYKNKPCRFIVRLSDYEYRDIQKKIDEDILKRFNQYFTKESTIYPPFVEVDEYGNATLQERDEYRFVCEFPDGYEKYLKQKEKLVGSCKKMELPEYFQKYYDFLYSAEESLSYGYSSGIAGAQPMGRTAMAELLKLNDKNVFISLLKGDNPCGRIYAAEGLLRLENSKDNVNLINKIFSPLIKEKITYDSIEGCLASTNKYEYFKYDENQSFPGISVNSYMVSDDASDLVLDFSFLDDLVDSDSEPDLYFLDDL